MIYFLYTMASMNLFLSLLFLIRKLLDKQLSPIYYGKFWNLAGLALLFSIPNPMITGLRDLFFYRIQDIVSNKANSTPLQLGKTERIIENVQTGWMNDNAIPASDALKKFIFIVLLIWTIGAIVALVRSLYTYIQFRKLLRTANLLVDDRVDKQLKTAMKRLGYQRDRLVLMQSAEIDSPATFGVFCPAILLPDHFIDTASDEQLFFILMHELVHQKNKDSLQNYLLMVLMILNWFNPVTYLIAKQARQDREISCDQSVMRFLNEEDVFFYGSTLLDCASKNEHSYVLSFSAKKNDLSKRIEFISSFQSSSPKKFATKFTLISVLVVCLFLIVPQARTEEKDQFSSTNKSIEQKSDPIFDTKKNNSLVIYDESKNRYLTYNPAGGHSRYSPDSTYKIWSALFALEEKKIDRTNNQRSWDGTSYPYDSWNQDQDLKMALTNSTNWYFQQVDSELGKGKLKEHFHSINYGNMNLLGGIDNYWLESSLKISPFEQVELLRKLFNGELNYAAENMAFVKESIYIQSQLSYTLYGKTGTGNSVSASTGWFIGAIETGSGNYYFSCHLQGEKATGTAAAKKTLAILRELEIY